MSQPRLEHTNLSVSDPTKTAAMLEAIFGWKIRWQGEAIEGGFTIHIGSDDDYLALYTHPDMEPETRPRYRTVGALNHIGVVVDDLEAIEKRVVKAGLKMGQHYDYEPGRRFYFFDDDEVEYEVISYQ